MRSYSIQTPLKGLSDLIHSEIDPTFTSEKRVLLAGSGGVRSIPAHALIAFVGVNPVVSAGAAVGNGNGAISAISADNGAQEGEWQIVFTSAASNAGGYEVIRPDGTVDGSGTVPGAYNGTVNFTLADGTTDFAVGTRIPLTVAYASASEKVVRWDPTATTTAKYIKGLACFDAEAADGVDGEITTLERGPAVLRREAIVFHEGATDAQKQAAYDALQGLNLVARQSG